VSTPTPTPPFACTSSASIAWDGEPQPLEDQAIRWQRVGATDVSPMLPANAPVLAALALPAVMVVSNAAHDGHRGLDPEARASVRSGSGCWCQVREKGMERMKLQHLLSRALTRAEPFGSVIVVNSDNGAFPQCRGVHLTSKALMTAAPARCGPGRRLLP
jgi:8-oxo-dGTP diphosphatase